MGGRRRGDGVPVDGTWHFDCWGTVSIPDQETKSPQATRHGQKKILIKNKKECNSDTCYNMNELENMKLSEMSDTKAQIFCDSTYMKHLKQANPCRQKVEDRL